MKMVVGLGNPGKEYELTRHNIGFMVIDKYACDNNILEFKNKYNGLYAKVNSNNESFILLKPMSYMNLSGTVIKKIANFYRIKSQDIMIIHDDMDLPVGKIKIKYKGSSGGHNGIKSIIENLQTEEFPRFKVGISKSDTIDSKNYVLGKFGEADLEKINKILAFSSNIIDDFVMMDIEKVMSKYNGEEYEFK